MMKKFPLILLLLATLLGATLPVAAGQEPAGLSAVAPWPQKADWVGQQAVIYPAKLYATASYLLMFQQPGQEVSGADQLSFARRYIGQTFTITGLFKLAKPAGSEYYWRLTGAGGTAVWVKDTPAGRPAVLPFALGGELAAENNTIAEIAALVGTTVWINRNLIAASELTAAVGHLAPLTITAFKTAGPFSDAYSLEFRQEDGTPVVWVIGTTGARTVYSNNHFYARVQKSFFRQNPQTLFPLWAEHLWPLIKAREIRVGWDREMVLMSWGDPDKAEIEIKGPEKGLEHWRYGSTNLYFRDKLLVKIKIPDPALANAKPVADGDRKNAKDEGLIEVPGAGKKDDGQPAGSK